MLVTSSDESQKSFRGAFLPPDTPTAYSTEDIQFHISSTSSMRTMLASGFCAVALCIGDPMTAYATTSPMLLAENNNIPPIIALSSESSSSNSANAARLLLDGPTTASRPNPIALQQLAKQKALQDRRLEQCQEGGKDWEQCFFYGTDPNPQENANIQPSKTKSKIPTW